MGPLCPVTDSTICSSFQALEVLFGGISCLVGTLSPLLFGDSFHICIHFRNLYSNKFQDVFKWPLVLLFLHILTPLPFNPLPFTPPN